MTPFIQLLHTIADRGNGWCNEAPVKRLYAMTNMHKAIFLMRQMFAIQYTKFMSYSYPRILDQYQEWVLLQCDALQASLSKDHTDICCVDLIATIRNMHLGSTSIAELDPRSLEGYLDADMSDIPCQIPQRVWRPFYLYCNLAKASETVGFNPSNVERQTMEGSVLPPELAYRRIVLTPVDAVVRFSIDPINNLNDLHLNNVFGYLSCFDWQNVPAEYIFGMLAKLSMPTFNKDILCYVKDCVWYNGKTSDPVLNIQDYDIGGGQSKALLTFLLNLRTRYNVEFRSSEIVNRLLLVDRTGGISKSLAEQFHLELDVTPPVGRSMESLAAYPYSFLHSLFMAKNDPQDDADVINAHEDDVDKIKAAKAKPKPKSKDTDEDVNIDNVHEDDVDKVAGAEADEEAADPESTDDSDMDVNNIHEDDVDKLTDADADPESEDPPEDADATPEVDANNAHEDDIDKLADPKEATTDGATSDTPEVDVANAHENDVDKLDDTASTDETDTADTSADETADPVDDSGATQSDPATDTNEPPTNEAADPAVSSDESNPNESESPTDPDLTPAEDADSEVGNPSETTIGDLTIKLAEAPSLQTVLLKDQIKLYIDQILANPPPEFTQQELDILRNLRLHWLYLYSVDTITNILDKVLTGKSLPKLVIQ